MKLHSNYDKFPAVYFPASPDCSRGWDAVGRALRGAIDKQDRLRIVIACECYPGVHDEEILAALVRELRPALTIRTRDSMWPAEQIDRMVEADITADPVFGRISKLNLDAFFDPVKVENARQMIQSRADRVTLIYGVGATLFGERDLLIYADLARWEAQMRFRRNEISNLGTENRSLKWSLQYKRAFFVDWRVCDRTKRECLDRIDFLLDTNAADDPKLLGGDLFRDALARTARRPFRVVPFFDPAPWGGQWMKNVCDLDRSASNFGWCFDCVPEENSLLLQFGDVRVEVPAIDLVFYQPSELLGQAVYGRFGAEFPIRFDFLDTIGGGNLSLQVHPLTQYIREHFGMDYTQDESYYMLDAGGDACVYLGLKDDAEAHQFARDLAIAQHDPSQPFKADAYVNRWPAKKHDHFLIPAGTVHCSGANSMVLEISATPYIFTFKMWDWGRLGLDGQPRPIHLDRALKNIQWDRRTDWTKRNLVNRVDQVSQGDGWREERTGLHELEFIETRRHWFSKPVSHHTQGNVNVLNLVEGREAIIESPAGTFAPMVVHYAETFIVPAAVGEYSIRPHGPSAGSICATMKAWVRT